MCFGLSSCWLCHSPRMISLYGRGIIIQCTYVCARVCLCMCVVWFNRFCVANSEGPGKNLVATQTFQKGQRHWRSFSMKLALFCMFSCLCVCVCVRVFDCSSDRNT